MSDRRPPPLPPRDGKMEHKPTKIDGGLPVPELVKRPPPPPPPKPSGG